MATNVTSVDFIPVSDAGDTMTGPLILSADPVVALGAATKQYADLTGAGFFILTPCVVSTTANLNATPAGAGVGATLTNAGVQAAFSADGVSPPINSRILVPFQTLSQHSGIYELTTVGTGATNWVLTRTTDFDTAAEILPGSFVTVTSGTLYTQSSWIQTATVVTVDTDPITWAQFTSSPNTFATKELNNLSGVAVNTPLLSALDNTIDFGSDANRFANAYTTTNRTGKIAGDQFAIEAYDVDGINYVPFVTLTANNTPTCILDGDVTSTTQAASDNTTKLATTAYADAQATLGASTKANKALDNLAAVAINTTLKSDTDITDDLGTGSARWKDGFIQNLKAGTIAADTLTLQAYDTDLTGYVTFATLTSDITPTMSLSGSVTGVTQAPANNSTKLATTAYADAASTGAGATKALDNLASVAINTTLVSDTDVTDNLGTQAIRWNNIYSATLQTGDTAADTLKIGAWDVDGAVISDFITLTANNTPTCVLASGVTATTQAPADNSTKIATTAYADAIGTAGANTALSNLAAVAINTSLVSDTDVTDSLGTQAIRWNNIYTANLQTGDTAADTLKIGAWDVDGAVIADFITLTANNTPTCVLASGVTGTTQAPADNSTKIATTAYVDSASGANTALSNLAAVAINTSLISDTDNTDSLGTGPIRWKDIYSATLKTGTVAANTLVLSARDVDGSVDTPFITLTANNTPTCVIDGAVTGTTQAPGTNNTTLATTAYADAGIVQYANLGSQVVNSAFNLCIGMLVEELSAVVTSAVGVVTLTVQRLGGGDLTAFFNGGPVIIDCTPPLTIALTAGTDTVPQTNYVYIRQATPTVLTKSLTGFPAAEEYIPISYHVVESAATVATFGTYNSHFWADDPWDTTTENGHITDLSAWVRRQPATWISGTLLTPTLTVIGPDTLTFATTSGVILQLHQNPMPAFNSATAGSTNLTTFFVANNNAGAYTQGKDLFNFKLTAAGAAAANNNRICWVVWGVISDVTGACKMYVNLPTGFYTTDAAAIADSSLFSNYTIPSLFTGAGFLIARLIYTYTTAAGGHLTLVQQDDLRGLNASVKTGGGITGATIELNNLGVTAINTALLPGVDNTIDLGDGTHRFRELFAARAAPGTTTGNALILSARNVGGASDTTFITLTSDTTTPTCVIASAVTGTTQAANNNSTKLATTAYADNVPTSGGGLVWIATVTAAAGANALFDNKLTSTYDNYMVVFEAVLPATNATSHYMQFGTGGTPTYQTTNYQSGTLTNVGVISFSGPTTAIGVNASARVANTAARVGGGSLVINNANSATLDKVATGTQTFVDSTAAGENAGCFGGRWKDATTAITSVRFNQSSGNISGTWKLYGMKN